MAGLGGDYPGLPTGHSEIGYRPPGPKKRSGGLGGGGVVVPRSGQPKGGGGKKKRGKGGGRINLPSTSVNVKGPDRPDLTPIDPQAEFDPDLEAYRDRYTSQLDDFKEGSGFAMDVLTGQQQDMKLAAQENAMSAAASAGIPFDAGQWGAEYDRGTNAAMAGEKLGREAMMFGALQGGLETVSRPSEERFARLDLDLRRDLGESSESLKRYGIDVGKYGKDVDAAIGSNNALLSFISSLMGSMSPSSSYTGGSVSYG